MRLTDYLDKGASLDPAAPCLTMNGRTRSYAEVQRLSWLISLALQRSGVRPGDRVAVLSENHPVAFAAAFGIARAGAIWCPVNPRNDTIATANLLRLLGCSCLIFQHTHETLVARVTGDLPGLLTAVCLDGVPSGPAGAVSLRDWLQGLADEPLAGAATSGADGDVAMIGSTAGTTGSSKSIVLTARNLETMAALVMMSYPFSGRPAYLAVRPATHSRGLLCLPILALGGEVVFMPTLDMAEFLALIAQHQVTHTYLPPWLLYQLLDHPALASADLSSLQCLWYGGTAVAPARLAEAIDTIGPVLGQVFGQAEAPFMISALAPADHFRADGSKALERYSSAGRPTPLTAVAIMDEHGELLPTGHRGEIVVRGSLVMAGYYRNAVATAAVSRHGWHHTGDIGYLDADNFLYVVDRAQDVIVSGGFSVYSGEVEQALLQHPGVQDCAVVGLPDAASGERVTAVIQPRSGPRVSESEVCSFVTRRLGGFKAPRQVEMWADLPRSRTGAVMKHEVRDRLLRRGC
jgi:fatty-acyl-CoA synthase